MSCVCYVVYITETYHASHGMHTTSVACSDEEVGVAPHEVLRHPNLNSVGKKAVGVSLKGLDVTENVVPSTTIESN